MISCLEELRSAKAILRDAQLELQQEGISHRGNVPVGMMIEVPAAIVMEMLERYLPEARQLARGEGRGLVAEAEVRV